MSLLKAIQFIPVNQKGNAVQSCQITDDATMDTQFALIKAGKAGTAGALDGVICKWGQYGVVLNQTVAGVSQTTDAAGNFILGSVTDHFGNPGGVKSALVAGFNLGAPALADDDIVHAAITNPSADSTTAVHAAITLTTSSQTVSTGITNPSGRLPSITGGASGQAGPVTLNGLDLNGDAASVTLLLSGTSTVKATLQDLPYGLDTVTSIVVPPYTNNGSDTVAVGYGDLVVVSSITDPDVPQLLTVKGAEADQTQVIKFYGTDYDDEPLFGQATSNGTSAANSNYAFKSVLSIAVPAQNDAGETTKIGTSNCIGLPYRMDHIAVLAAQLGTAHEGTYPTVTYDGTVLAGNTILLSFALDGAKSVVVDFIRCDAPLEFDRF